MEIDNFIYNSWREGLTSSKFKESNANNIQVKNEYS